MKTQSVCRSAAGVACLFIVLQDILYGLGDPLSKAAYEVMSVYSLLSIRYAIALICLIFIGRKRIVDGLKQCPIRIWLLPSICIAGCYLLNNAAMEFASATSTAFLRSLSTVITPLLAFLVFRTKFRWIHIPIQVFIVVGLYLLCCEGGLSGFGIGEVLSLLSALLMAGALVFGAEAMKKMDSITLSTVQTATSVVMATICAFLFDGGLSVANATIPVWGTIVYLAVCCTLVGYLLQNSALQKISSRVVALLQCACPVMTALFSFWILGEQLSLSGMIGAGIILIGVVAETVLD